MNILVCNTEVKNVDGLYCLNDLHKASGGAKTKRPAHWLRTDQTKALVRAVESEVHICASLKIVQGGRTEDRGTYACKELVYAYAMWISPEFHIHVIRAYDAMVTGDKPEPMSELDMIISAAREMKAQKEAQEVVNRAHEEEISILSDKIDFATLIPTIPRVIHPKKFVGNSQARPLEGVMMQPMMHAILEAFVESYNATRSGKHEITVNSIVHAALQQFLYNPDNQALIK